MARRDSRRGARTNRGWWGAVFSLAVLACVAFVVGGLAGLIWKEPGLLFAYLTGETREVAWGVADPSVVAESSLPAELPPVPLSPAQPSSPRPAPMTDSPPRPGASPAVAAAPPPATGARIAIQVGAFAERDSAELLRGELQKGGYPAYVAAAAASGSPHWRVRVGPYASRGDAERVASQLKSARALPTWVLDEDAQ